MAGGFKLRAVTAALLQRKTLKALQEQWEVDLLRALQETKATMGRQAYEGQPTLYPFLCLLSEKELVSILLQVGCVWRRLGTGQMAVFRQSQHGLLLHLRFCRYCLHRVSPLPSWPKTWAFRCLIGIW